MHTAMEHVSVKVALTHRVFLQGQVYRMPRNVKGIGRTGKKHKKPADGGSSRLPDQEGITGPLFTPLLPFNNYTRFFEAAIQRSRFVLGRSSPVSNQCYTCLLDVPNRFFQRVRTQQPSAFKYLQTSISTLVSGSRG